MLTLGDIRRNQLNRGIHHKTLRFTATWALILQLVACGGGGGGGTGGGSSAAVSSGGANDSTGTGTGTGTGGIGNPLTCPLNSYSPNYCQETDPATAQSNDLHWWNHFPLKVYFTSSPTKQGQALNPIVLSGFNAWQVVSGSAVATTVGSAAQADIVVSYENTATMPGGWIGRATFSYAPFNRQAFSGTVTLKTWDNMSMAEVVDGLRRTAQHEFGHILFLDGHSTVAADTMYPSGPQNQYTPLTTRDQNTFKTTYCGTFGGPGGLGGLSALGGGALGAGSPGIVTRTVED